MVKSGFFNSLKDSSGNADRTYGASDFSEIFNGVITDGVYEHVGDCFKIENVTDTELTVKPGRCWLNGCWMANTEDLILDNRMNQGGLQPIEGTYWYTVVYIEVDKTVSGRSVSIKSESGTAYIGTEPLPLHNTDEIFRYRIADIKNYYGTVTEGIVPHSVDFKIGSDELPFVNCPLESISLEEHFKRWELEFDALEDVHKKTFSDNLETIMFEWNTWFSGAKSTLDEDVAGNLLNLIIDLQNTCNRLSNTLSSATTDIRELNNDFTAYKQNDMAGIKLLPITPDAYDTLVKAGTTDSHTLYIVMENPPEIEHFTPNYGQIEGPGDIPGDIIISP